MGQIFEVNITSIVLDNKTPEIFWHFYISFPLKWRMCLLDTKNKCEGRTKFHIQRCVPKCLLTLFNFTTLAPHTGFEKGRESNLSEVPSVTKTGVNFDIEFMISSGNYCHISSKKGITISDTTWQINTHLHFFRLPRP
jgi:hypothetical protein